MPPDARGRPQCEGVCLQSNCRRVFEGCERLIAQSEGRFVDTLAHGTVFYASLDVRLSSEAWISLQRK